MATGTEVGGRVPPGSVGAGNPGRVAHRRFGATEVSDDLRIARWHWPVDRILANGSVICGGDVAARARV